MQQYKSEAERERENWFELLEAFTLVCADYGFEDAEKLTRDLLAEEGEKKKIPRAWEEPPEPGRGPAYNLPPQGGKCWLGLEINFHSDCQVKDDLEWVAYFAADEETRRKLEYPREPRHRTLLLHKATFLAAYAALRLAREKAAPEASIKRGQGGKTAAIRPTAAIRKTFPKGLPDLPNAKLIEMIKEAQGVEVSVRTLSRFRSSL